MATAAKRKSKATMRAEIIKWLGIGAGANPRSKTGRAICDELVAEGLAYKEDDGYWATADLRRAKPQAKIPGSTESGRRGVGRDRAKPDTSTYEGRFAARLGELAKDQGFEPADLAQRLGVSDQVVYDWLAGRKMPAVGRFPALAKMLKCKHPGDILPPK